MNRQAIPHLVMRPSIYRDLSAHERALSPFDIKHSAQLPILYAVICLSTNYFFGFSRLTRTAVDPQAQCHTCQWLNLWKGGRILYVFSYTKIAFYI
jgi:hypothetical protein